MHDRGDAEQEARLEEAVLTDPGSSGFSALAELYRRDGRIADAEAVARAGLRVKPDAWEGRVALALALLDRGLEYEAREELERVVRESAELHGISLGATSALGAPVETRDLGSDTADEGAPAGIGESEPEDGDGPLGGTFATETMAGLLERQGDRAAAERIRASLGSAVRADEPIRAQAHILQELERWLFNAQQRAGGRA